LPGVQVPRACPQHRVEGVDGNAPVSPQERLVEPANPDILNTPAAIAIREGMREQGAWIMTQRERAEAAPPASPEQRALDCEIDRMMRELMFPRFIIPEREDAEARGIAWLKSCLSPEQLADYDRTHSFVVIGGHTRHRYRICWGTSQNIIRIEMLENGRELPVERLCFGPRGVPIGDILLHQKIALEGDEQAALWIAGRAPVPLLPGNYMHPDWVGQRLQVRMPPDYGVLQRDEF
jgi:hypothetical protein